MSDPFRLRMKNITLQRIQRVRYAFRRFEEEKKNKYNFPHRELVGIRDYRYAAI